MIGKPLAIKDGCRKKTIGKMKFYLANVAIKILLFTSFTHYIKWSLKVNRFDLVFGWILTNGFDERLLDREETRSFIFSLMIFFNMVITFIYTNDREMNSQNEFFFQSLYIGSSNCILTFEPYKYRLIILIDIKDYNSGKLMLL